MTATRKLVAAGSLGVLVIVLIAVYITQWLTVGPTAVASAAPQNGVTSQHIHAIGSAFIGTCWRDVFLSEHSSLTAQPTHTSHNVPH